MKKSLGFLLFLVLLGTSVTAFAEPKAFGGFGEVDDSAAALAGAGVGDDVVGVQEAANYSIRLWKNAAVNRVYSRSTITVTDGVWDYLKTGNKICRRPAPGQPLDCSAWNIFARYNVATNIWCGWWWVDLAGSNYYQTKGTYYFREGTFTDSRALSIFRYN